MTQKQRRFVEEYLIDLDADSAAIRAGYSPNANSNRGESLLRKPEISAAIEKAIAERSRRTGVNSDRIIHELAKIAFLDPSEISDSEDIAREDMAALAALKLKRTPTDSGEIVETSFKTFDKLRALELLGKHLGIWDGKSANDKNSAVDDWIRAMTELDDEQN